MEQLLSLLDLSSVKNSPKGKSASKPIEEVGEEKFQTALDSVLATTGNDEKELAKISAKAVVTMRQNKERLGEEQEIKEIRGLKNIKDILVLSGEKKLGLKSLTIEIKQEGKADSKLVIKTDGSPEESPTKKLQASHSPLRLSTTGPVQETTATQKSAALDLQELLSKIQDKTENSEKTADKVVEKASEKIEKETSLKDIEDKNAKEEKQELKASQKTLKPSPSSLHQTPSSLKTDTESKTPASSKISDNVKPPLQTEELPKNTAPNDAAEIKKPDNDTNIKTTHTLQNTKKRLPQEISEHEIPSNQTEKASKNEKAAPSQPLEKSEQKNIVKPETATPKAAKETHQESVSKEASLETKPPKEAKAETLRPSKDEAPVNRETKSPQAVKQPGNSEIRPQPQSIQSKGVPHQPGQEAPVSTPSAAALTKEPTEQASPTKTTPNEDQQKDVAADPKEQIEEPTSRPKRVTKPGAEALRSSKAGHSEAPQNNPLQSLTPAVVEEEAALPARTDDEGKKPAGLSELIRSPKREIKKQERVKTDTTQQAETVKQRVTTPKQASPVNVKEETPLRQNTQNEAVKESPKAEPKLETGREEALPAVKQKKHTPAKTAPKEQPVAEQPNETPKSMATETVKNDTLLKHEAPKHPTLGALLNTNNHGKKVKKESDDVKAAPSKPQTADIKNTLPLSGDMPPREAESVNRDFISKILSKNLSAGTALSINGNNGAAIPQGIAPIAPVISQQETTVSSETVSTELQTETLKSEEIRHDPLKQRVASAKTTVSHFAQNLKEQVQDYKAPLMKITMDLNPKNLGSVGVTLLNRGKNLHVQIHSNAQAIQLFMQNNLEFKNALNDLGYKDVQLNFSFGQGSSSNHNGGGYRKQDLPSYFTNNSSSNTNQTETDEMEIILPNIIYG